MRHVPRSRLLAFDADELSPRSRSRTARHLRGCGRCRARLTRLREIRERARVATRLDAPPAFREIEARLDAGERLILPRPDASSPKRRPTDRRTAAVAVLAATVTLAGSVAAATGKLQPMTRWVLEQIGAAGEAPAPRAGVEVPVPGEGMTVELRNPGPDVLLRVERTEGHLLQVIGLGEASTARFSTGSGVAVTDARRGAVVIRVPRRAGPVRVLTGQRTLVTVARDPSTAKGRPVVELRLGDTLP